MELAYKGMLLNLNDSIGTSYKIKGLGSELYSID
jgi:hypothetical protein